MEIFSNDLKAAAAYPPLSSLSSFCPFLYLPMLHKADLQHRPCCLSFQPCFAPACSSGGEEENFGPEYEEDDEDEEGEGRGHAPRMPVCHSVAFRRQFEVSPWTSR